MFIGAARVQAASLSPGKKALAAFIVACDLRAPTGSVACHTMLNVRLSRPIQPLPHTLSYLIL